MKQAKLFSFFKSGKPPSLTNDSSAASEPAEGPADLKPSSPEIFPAAQDLSKTEGDVKSLSVSPVKSPSKEKVNLSIVSPPKRKAIEASSPTGVTERHDVVEVVHNNEGELDYEDRRMQNLRRNAEFLQMLGLGDVKSLMAPVAEPSGAPQKKKRSRDSNPAPRGSMPTRRSMRNAMKESVNYSDAVNSATDANRNDILDEDADIDNQEDGVEDAALYDDSSVLRYVLSEQSHSDSSSMKMNNPNELINAGSGALRIGSDSLALDCDDLAAVYSVHIHPVHPRLLMAAGKGGQIVLYKVPNSSDTIARDGNNVLMSFKAHSKWIGSAKFISSANHLDKSIFAVSTADDGLVKLWDLTASKSIGGSLKQDSMKPRMLLSSSSVHEKGIYAMDICGQSLLTGSKDKTICISDCAISSMEGEKAPKVSLEVKSRFSHHSSIIKSVAWQEGGGGPGVFASGGQDNRVCIKDIRSPASLADLQVTGLYGSGGVHTVKWSPEPDEPFLLLTAGFGDALKLFDVRRPEASFPLFELRGHCFNPRSVASGVILSPTFLSGHHAIATAGYGNSLVSIYSTTTGKCTSRGELAEQPKSVYFGHCNEIFMSCHRTGTIYRHNLVV